MAINKDLDKLLRQHLFGGNNYGVKYYSPVSSPSPVHKPNGSSSGANVKSGVKKTNAGTSSSRPLATPATDPAYSWTGSGSDIDWTKEDTSTPAGTSSPSRPLTTPSTNPAYNRNNGTGVKPSFQIAESLLPETSDFLSLNPNLFVTGWNEANKQVPSNDSQQKIMDAIYNRYDGSGNKPNLQEAEGTTLSPPAGSNLPPYYVTDYVSSPNNPAYDRNQGGGVKPSFQIAESLVPELPESLSQNPDLFIQGWNEANKQEPSNGSPQNIMDTIYSRYDGSPSKIHKLPAEDRTGLLDMIPVPPEKIEDILFPDSPPATEPPAEEPVAVPSVSPSTNKVFAVPEGDEYKRGSSIYDTHALMEALYGHGMEHSPAPEGGIPLSEEQYGEGDQLVRNILAQYGAMTGGIPWASAVTAAANARGGVGGTSADSNTGESDPYLTNIREGLAEYTENDKLQAAIQELIDNEEISEEVGADLYIEFEKKGLTDRTWTMVEDGGLYIGAIDDDASAEDEYGNVYTMAQLIDLLTSDSYGMSKEDAKKWVKDLQKDIGATKW